jgi:SET domain-containing protein
MKQNAIPPQFEIKKGIHGVGVFAKSDIRRGTILFKLSGKIIDEPTRTSVQVGENKHVENILAGHMNHSCTPNAKVYKRLMALISLSDIKEGDEITFDYNDNEDVLAAPFICECCGKKICGKIKTPEEDSKK